MTLSAHDKRDAFRRLHQEGCFVLPNPWDVGSAKVLQHRGFKALATTSAGMAWSITVTPTWQKGILFARGELSYTDVGGGTPGRMFGAQGANKDQFRGLIEAGVAF